jgi:transcriptional regulator with XRE-family HTH domain
MRDVRNSRDMTQQDLADGMGVTIGWISQLENGKGQLTHEMLVRACFALDCKPNDLVDTPPKVNDELAELTALLGSLDHDKLPLALKLLKTLE